MRVMIFSALLLAALPALAGEVRVSNASSVHVGEFHSESDARSWPFDLDATFAEFSSKRAVDDAAARCVTTPRKVCVVVDPVHRFTRTHFGVDSDVPRSSFERVASAGNSAFKRGDWAGGIGAIADAAADAARAHDSAATRAVPMMPVAPRALAQPTSSSGETHWGLILFVLLIIGGGVAAVWFAQKRRRQRFAEESEERRRQRTRNFVDTVEATKKCTECTADVDFPRGVYIVKCKYCGKSAERERPVDPTPLPPPVPAQVVYHYDHGGGGGGASAADVMLAYEMGRSAHREPVRETVIERRVEVVEERRGGGSFGGGGASSSWDSDSSVSSSSFDAGGGGGDFGGGCDGGGGGGDF